VALVSDKLIKHEPKTSASTRGGDCEVCERGQCLLSGDDGEEELDEEKNMNMIMIMKKKMIMIMMMMMMTGVAS